MRIAIINATGGGMSGGYRRYLENVLPRLARHSQVSAILCATPPIVGIEKNLPPLPIIRYTACRPFRFMCHSHDEELRKSVEAFAPDVIFIPISRYLQLNGIPLVIMIQNMGPLFPNFRNPMSEHIRYAAQRYEMKIAIRKAEHIIVPTNFVNHFLQQQWHVSSGKLSTIHYGVDECSSGCFVKKPATIPEELEGRFLFTAGSIEPYRGLEDILEAFRLLDHSGIAGLMIAGESRWNMKRYERRLRRWIYRHGLSKKIYWTGFLSTEEMAWCYRHSVAFVMTSRVESFAMIGIEALAHGCICVVANNPPLPEIFGATALYYPPKDSNALVATIIDVVHWNDAKRHTVSVRAKQRATQFSWDANVNQLVEVLQKTIDDRAGRAV